MRHILFNRWMMKVYILSFILLWGFSNVRCSDDKVKSEPLLHNFTVWIGEQKVEALVNNDTRQIVINGVTDGNKITDVEYTLGVGTELYPKPQYYLNNWGKEISFVARAAGMTSVTYTVQLKDYEKPLKNAFKVWLGDRKQQLILMGGDMERSQFFLQKAANPEEVARWCFQDINFGVCRVSYDKKQELEEGQKDFNFYADAVKSMQLLRKVNPGIQFWATMKSDYNGFNNENNLPDWICDYKPTTRFDCAKYAVFLADYLAYMQQNGVGIKYLAIAKEWTGVVNASRAKEIITKLNVECVTRGITKPLYVDPASWGITQGADFIKSAAEIGSMDLYYGFSTHNLNTNELDQYLYEKFVAEARKYQKYAFADETATGAGGRTTGEEPETLDQLLDAYGEKAEFYKDGIQGELFFEPFSRGVNAETRSIYFKKDGPAKRMRSYYVMKTFVNAIADGKYYLTVHPYEVGPNVSAMAFVDDEELVFCLVNRNDSNLKDISVLWEGALMTGKVEQTVFEVSLPIDGQKSELDIKDNSLLINLLAKSITFLKIKL